MNELSIGSKIELPFVTLEVCEVEMHLASPDCSDCFFAHVCEELKSIETVEGVVGECVSGKRSDKKGVYFKVIERK